MLTFVPVKVPTFAVPVTFARVAITLVVQKLLENQAFPWTVRLALAAVPMPMFEVAVKVPTFAVTVMFAEVATTLVVQKLFENHAFPWTVRFALASVPIPMFVPVKVPTFAVPVIFAEVITAFDAQKLFENQAFPWTMSLYGTIPAKYAAPVPPLYPMAPTTDTIPFLDKVTWYPN